MDAIQNRNPLRVVVVDDKYDANAGLARSWKSLALKSRAAPTMASLD
jgi:hypothetical protein